MLTGPFRGVAERQEQKGGIMTLQTREGRAALEEPWNILNASHVFSSSKRVPSAS